jgi:hypothetical protein
MGGPWVNKDIRRRERTTRRITNHNAGLNPFRNAHVATTLGDGHQPTKGTLEQPRLGHQRYSNSAKANCGPSTLGFLYICFNAVYLHYSSNGRRISHDRVVSEACHDNLASDLKHPSSAQWWVRCEHLHDRN